MGKGTKESNGLAQQPQSSESIENNYNVYTWKQMKESENYKKWFVINGVIYDISKFAKRHPGGERLMLNHNQQDCTDAFVAFHKDLPKVKKYMKMLEIGRIVDIDNTNGLTRAEAAKKHENEVKFRNLRNTAEKMNLFDVNPLFFIAQFMHIMLLEAIGFFILYKYPGWLTYLLGSILFTIVQAQSAWLQHDFGHLSVFKSSKMNHLVQTFLINFTMGFSSIWWNYRHYQHHAKPNIIRKDPDIRFGALFMLGKTIPRELGEKKIGKYPYKLQQYYFFMIVPPLLMTVYFLFENIYYLIKNKEWKELALTTLFFIKWFGILVPSIGIGASVALLFFVRFLYSHWFVWVTQMNHLPMDIERDQELDWFSAQLQATCNVNQSFFNDWFTGHLNFQIEHHLFPTMPRHNYHKINALVKSLCKETKVEYVEKTLLGAMADIYHSLKASGELWFDAYNQ